MQSTGRRIAADNSEGKIATAEDAARVDEDPPLDQLLRVLEEKKETVEKGESVVYWMRMEDIRSKPHRLPGCAS